MCVLDSEIQHELWVQDSEILNQVGRLPVSLRVLVSLLSGFELSIFLLSRKFAFHNYKTTTREFILGIGGIFQLNLCHQLLTG